MSHAQITYTISCLSYGHPKSFLCREGPDKGESSGTVSESKERIQGALMPTNTGPSLRWEHKVELWKHPKAGPLLADSTAMHA